METFPLMLNSILSRFESAVNKILKKRKTAKPSLLLVNILELQFSQPFCARINFL